MECRDWLKTLWHASFKGVAFYFDSDDEEGGQDNVKHLFPHRDDPFIEPMGESLRYYSGAAYVFGDNVDQLEASMKAVMSSGGPGTLVTPLSGPVTVHAEEFKRRHDKDKLGYAAFEVKFVRAGASTGLISIPLARNIAFQAADKASASIATNFARALSIGPFEADFVVAAAVDGLSSAVASLDVIRTSYNVDPVASGGLRDAIQYLLANIPSAIASGGDAAAAVVAKLVGTTRSLADAMPAVSAASAMMEFAGSYPRVDQVLNLTPTDARAAANAEAASRAARLSALTAYAEAILRTTYTSRPDGVTARANVAEIFENEEADTTGAANADLYLAIEDLRGRVIDYLSSLITNLAPVISVQTSNILPALYMAWRLYADPLRDDELVARNDVSHPAFMPRSFLALSR